MFRRTPKSSSAAGSALELLPGAETGLRAEHLEDWRDAAKRVARTYTAWGAAARRDREDLYVSFVDALRREERAARQLERDASALGAADPVLPAQTTSQRRGTSPRSTRKAFAGLWR